MQRLEIVVKHGESLHINPAGTLVKTAKKFQSEIYIHAHGQRANAKSITALTALGITQGSIIRVTARGEDEVLAVRAIEDLMKNLVRQEESCS